MIYQIYKDRSGHKKARPVRNRKALMALRNSATNLRHLKAYREGKKEEKALLLQLAYNARPVNGMLAGCKHYSSTFFHDIDCYNAEQAEEIKALVLSKKEEIGLLMLERSPSGGWHLVCRRERGKTILENQVRIATILNIEMDTNAKDLQRVVFSTSGSEDDLPFLDDAIFDEPMTEAESALEYERLRERQRNGLEEVPEGAKRANKHYRPWETTTDYTDYTDKKTTTNYRNYTNSTTNRDGKAQPNPCNPLNPLSKENNSCNSRNSWSEKNDPSFKGIPYSVIIDEWWQRTGGVPQEGERNVRLYQLAVNLRAICDNDKALLLKVMPRLGIDEQELHNIVESACKETPKGISKTMREILQTAGADTSQMATTAEDLLNSQLWRWGEQIEQLSEYYPVLKDICKGLKRNQYPAALFVAGGLLMTLMTRCTYRFYHRPEELRRLNNSTFIIGDPASGKSFATRLYKLISAPIARADMVGKEAINAYRELMRTKGANKEKPKKPKVIVRIHPSRTSNAQFIQDMVNSVEEVDGQPMQLHMLTFDTELDNTITVQKGGSWIDKMSMELKAFHNEEDGQAYSNNDSILQDFIVTWNFIYTGTPIALKKKVNAQNFGSGLATRLTCIPLPATNFEMLTLEETVDYESDHRLSHWADLLDRTKGELSVKKLVDELYEWTYRRMMDAKENDSHADEMLLKRCAYHGLNFSVPFIVMRHWDQLHKDGEFYCGNFETDDTDWRLCELIANIQYACQRHYFGALAEQYFDNKLKEASTNVQHQKKTQEGFLRLPEEFTTSDVMRCFNIVNEACVRMKIKRLTDDQLIEKTADARQSCDGKSHFRKTGRWMA